MNQNKLLLLLIVLLSISYSLAVVVPIPGENIPNGVNSNNKNKKDLKSAAEDLNYANIFRDRQGTIVKGESVRIDMQGSYTRDGQRWFNLQAQLNGIKGKSTIAHVNVAQNAMSNNLAEQAHVTNVVIAAMLNSYIIGKTYHVLDNGL
ncbi:hypothetical protein DDB_G0269008 [Dictyostelium discoideum AX4]|uniref:Uncharacterized protein n=1 Tax=Dictyostelium discoideum TaxID=44689 RepID=Q55EM5_DICDI|nr:hypothetical protein DDB_G0269008 [Dictyostelium discoideum AX4]EAL73093.1 hypothetical protein DDB_G0269008 [Dictyostelium discoideum AX4]|eukprot:XP_646995.1 hypothetical protein DDB_G0269008 [Dictyostelium discoideum AX4]